MPPYLNLLAGGGKFDVNKVTIIRDVVFEINLGSDVEGLNSKLAPGSSLVYSKQYKVLDLNRYSAYRTSSLHPKSPMHPSPPLRRCKPQPRLRYAPLQRLCAQGIVGQQVIQLFVARRAHDTRKRGALALATNAKRARANRDGESSADNAGKVGKEKGRSVVSVDVDGGFDRDVCSIFGGSR